MSSLVLLPSSSLLAAYPCSVHGAVAAGLPTSPTSSWSPATSPSSNSTRMHALSLATSASSAAPLTASANAISTTVTLPTAAAGPANAVVAHVLSSPQPRPSMPAYPTAATASAQPSYLRPSASMMSPAVAMAAGPSNLLQSQSFMPSTLQQQPTVQQSAAGYGSSGAQTIVFDNNGQAFILSPINNYNQQQQQQPISQPNQQQTMAMMQHFTVPSFSNNTSTTSEDWSRQAGQQPIALGSAISARSNTLMLTPQGQQQQQLQPLAWSGGESLSMLPAKPMSIFSSPHFHTQPMGSSMLHTSAGQPLLFATGPASATAFSGSTSSFSAAMSPVPVLAMSSAFQPLPKRASSAAGTPPLTSAAALQPLSPAVLPLHSIKPASPSTLPANASALCSLQMHTPQRKMSAASATSSSGSSVEGAAAADGSLAHIPYTPPTFARHSSDSGGEQSTSPRIDGLSSSRLLTHINKKPSHVLPFVIHRSQLPHNFDHLVHSASAAAQPSTPAPHNAALTGADMVTVNIRVMGGPSLSELYFVAADISQLIHSRKSNIAKAVSVFTDDERARCSVVCPRSNNTQSTHILTVLTMAGVKRLLHSSRSTIALPLLAWLQDKVDHIIAQDDTSRSYTQQQHQQQQQQRPPSASSTSSKRKSEGVESGRQQDVKEDDSGNEKRMKNE